MERKHLIGEIVCGVVDLTVAVIAIINHSAINELRVALPAFFLFFTTGLVSLLNDLQKREKPTVRTAGLILLGVVLGFCFY